MKIKEKGGGEKRKKKKGDLQSVLSEETNE